MMTKTEEIAFSGGNKTFALKGTTSIVIFALLAMLCFVGWLLWDASKNQASKDLAAVSDAHMQQREKMLAEQTKEHKAIIDAVTEIRSDHTLLGESLREVNKTLKMQNYIILAGEKERERIRHKLQMPPELKELTRE